MWKDTIRDISQRYYHVTSKGEESRDFILSDDDYYAAFNRIGICAAHCKVRILSFSIEDTHIHLLIFGSQAETAKFISMYEDLTVHYLKEHRSTVKGARLNLRMILIEDEKHLMNVGTYTIIQASKDGKRVMPYDYLWGTGCLYFRNDRQLPVWRFDENSELLPVRKCSGIPYREKRAILFSTLPVPDDWYVCGRFLLPTNYVDVAMFESIYQTQNCYRVFLGMSKAKEEDVMGREALSVGVRLEDLEARMICTELCKETFGRKGVRHLTVDQRMRLARECRHRYNMTLRQISSLVKIAESELRLFLR